MSGTRLNGRDLTILEDIAEFLAYEIMEYLPDGRRCKACTSTEEMMQMGRNFKKRKNNEKKANEDKPNNAVSENSDNKLRRLDCPVDKDELGRSTWNLLHTISTYYPENPATSDKNNMNHLLTSLSNTYPCEHCAEDFRNDLKENPPKLNTRLDFSNWMCELHNRVNKKIGKKEFDCNKVMERWFDGWKDGSCD